MNQLCFLSGMNSEQWAAWAQAIGGWVQAVGAITAICVSVYAVNRAHNLQIEQRKKEVFAEYTRHLEVLFQLLGAAHQIMVKIRILEGEYRRPTPDEYDTVSAEVGALAHAFNQYEMGRLDRYEFVEAWTVGSAAVKKMMSSIEYARSPNFSHQLEWNYLSRVTDFNMELLKPRAKLLYDIVAKRGGNAAPSDVPPE